MAVSFVSGISISKTLIKRSTPIPKFPVQNHLNTPQNSLRSTSAAYLKPKLPLSLIFRSHTQKPLTLHTHQQTQIKSLFTGIVEEMGQVRQLGFDESGRSFDMTIHSPTVLQDVNLGDSIAVNGTCLTVTEFDPKRLEFTVGVAPETLRLTSLMELEQGSVVNLERAVKPSTRMGGHFVQGHVDGTGEIVSLVPEGDSLWVKVKTSPEVLKFIVPKGFIAVDGASLTVVKVFDQEGCFNFMLVEYTQKEIVIPLKKIGQKVNLEVDILGKYVEKLLSSGFVESIKSR
ncbi:riboflavin synthase-like [Cynara cardunculus var. scolymus]|uniref:Riboflavin synthase n=1 Tax=Cynara cardunculus var. scolymus TaxID=59895 RepID=A0A103XS53_CYNCS|nr:riboflavin synthase-like [Cynara cardunculus var. scolymus]KVH95868.1 ATPase, F1/A1 complex, alpha subunit, N-terminal [Cynara cardunculus var. scolymus]